MREIRTRKKSRIKDFILQNIYDNLKSYLIIILILIMVGFPIVINEMYKYGLTISKPYITTWGADEVLSYYGTVLFSKT